MSHGCHTCHCPNGCRCNKLAKESRLRTKLGFELFDALVILGAAEAEKNRLEWALKRSEDDVADRLEKVKNLVSDQDLDVDEAEVGSDIWRGLCLLKHSQSPSRLHRCPPSVDQGLHHKITRVAAASIRRQVAMT